METLDKPEVGQLIKLFPKLNAQGQVDSVLPLQWSIAPETIQAIASKGIRDPHMLISVECDGREMQRYVVPLKREMVYVQFNHSGKNVVHATIVGTQPGEKQAAQILSRRGRNYYEDEVLNKEQPLAEAVRLQIRELWRAIEQQEEANGEVAVQLREEIQEAEREQWELIKQEPYEWRFFERLHNVLRVDYEAQLEVNVPAEMFAKKSEWMDRVGSIYSWGDRLGNQCDLRRRVLITLATLPFYMALKGAWIVVMEVAFLAVIAWGYFIGWRGASFEVLRDPIDGEFESIWRGHKPSKWLFREVTEDGNTRYVDRNLVFLALNPVTALVLIAIGILTMLLSQDINFIFGGILLGLILVGVFAAGILLWTLISNRRSRERSYAAVSIGEVELDELRRNLADLTEDRQRTGDVRGIKKPSVDLIFQDVKSKVCKPFER